MSSTWLVPLLGVAYITCSVTMITMNAYLMTPTRFPYPAYLVLCHTGVNSITAATVFFIRPSLFPAASAYMREGRPGMLRSCMLIAMFFAMQLVLSNKAYLYLSVAFLQMFKESASMLLVVCFSALFGIEYFNLSKVQVIAMVIFATTLTIRGELDMSWLGITIQSFCQVIESLKLVLEAFVLKQDEGGKLDVFSYILFVMPFTCMGILFIVVAQLIGLNQFNVDFNTASREDLYTWAPFLLVSSCVGLLLNVIAALFIQRTMAVTFVITGILKDSVLLFSGWLFFGEVFTPMQVTGFSLQLVCILLWSTVKANPETFDDGLGAGLYRMSSNPEPSDKHLENDGEDPVAARMYGSTGNRREKA